MAKKIFLRQSNCRKILKINCSVILNQSFNTSSNTSGSSFCDLNGSVTNLANPISGLQLPPLSQPQTQPQPMQEISVTNSFQNQQVPHAYSTTKLWDYGHSCTIYQQQPFMEVSYNLSTLIMPLTQNLTLPNQSLNLPLWIDPIWANNNNSEKPKDYSLNIRLPELKALNVLPMLLSPYSLSKTENMKQVFNFDLHNRKIASFFIFYYFTLKNCENIC